MFFQQLLAVTTDKPCPSINNSASEMIKALISQIKTNKTSRKGGELVHEITRTDCHFPLTLNKEKTKTRWQLFAESKGLKMKKKSKLVYNEELKKWIPRWGSGSLSNMKLQSGVVEVEQSISKMKKEKTKRVTQNLKNRNANKKRINKL